MRTVIVALVAAAVGAGAAWGVRGQLSGPVEYSVPRLADGHPDLNGVWQAVSAANWNIQDHAASAGPVVALGAAFSVPGGLGVVDGNELPYQDWALARRDENAAQWLTKDPEVKCYLPGVPRATYMPYPFQIVQGANAVLMAYEFAGATRLVSMAGASEPPAPSWMGFSRGRWDGDALVVEVTGFNEDTWFDRAGNFHSDEMRVVERYTRTGPDRLQYEATITDDKVFTRPWTMRMPLYRRLEPGARLVEYKCVEFVEELMYGHLRKVPRR